MNTLENMPMDLFIAYKLQKRVEEQLKEERLKKEQEHSQEPDTGNSKIVKSECHNCGQNWLWCICDHSILNEG
jgi:hypothetical protein